MMNLFMKFQNCNLIFVMDAKTDGWKDGQAKSNMRLQLFQSWGHKKKNCTLQAMNQFDQPIGRDRTLFEI